jgi:hypothetical protein
VQDADAAPGCRHSTACVSGAVSQSGTSGLPCARPRRLACAGPPPGADDLSVACGGRGAARLTIAKIHNEGGEGLVEREFGETGMPVEPQGSVVVRPDMEMQSDGPLLAKRLDQSLG